MNLIKLSPLCLKSFLFYRTVFNKSIQNSSIFKDVPLYFSPNLQMDLCTTDLSHKHIAYTGFFELELTKRIMKLSDRGGVFVDVGANYGYYSLLWTGKFKENKAFAFEAEVKNFKALSKNIEKNFLSSQITYYNNALGKCIEEMQFDPVSSTQTSWGGLTNKKDTGVTIDVKTLDSFFAKSTFNINVLKIDVEGADTWVLYGAENLLKKKKVEYIFFEKNFEREHELGINRNEVHKYLNRLNYRVERISDKNGVLEEFFAYPK